MTESSKHQLAEVLCGFWFSPEQNPWDSTFFGKYFDKIEPEGYTEKKEQQGYQIKFELKNPAIENPTAQADKLEPRMLFKNPESNTAILMASNYISFHKLPPYNSWEDFLEKQIKPDINHYKNIGLGNSLMHIQMLYLNQYFILIKMII